MDSETVDSPFGSRIFVDRDVHKHEFDTVLGRHGRDPQPRSDARNIHVWWGMGGLGKTELRQEFELKIRQRQEHGERIALGVLDFDNARHRDPMQALLKLRLEFGRVRKFRAPTFDLAFGQLFALECPGDELRAKHPGLFRPYSEQTEDLLEYLDRLCRDLGVLESVLPPASLLFKYGVRIAGELCDWWNRREVRRYANQIHGMTGTQLRELLPSCLGFDLRGETSTANGHRFVLLLDTLDALSRQSPGRSATRNDGWIRTLIKAAPGTLVAIFARDKLRWHETDSSWSETLHEHTLEGLADVDADRFLSQAGVEAAPIRARIVACARGLPFYLGLARDQYERMRANSLEPSAEDFAAAQDEVLRRFLEHVSDHDRDQLRVASYPEEIDRSVFERVCAQFFLGRGGASWPRLMQYSIMNASGPAHASMQALAREGMQARERADDPAFFQEVHEWLAKHYEGVADSAPTASEIRSGHDHALVTAARHLRTAQQEVLIPWILQQRWQKFYTAMRWKALAEVFAAADSAAQTLPADSIDGVWFNHHCAHVYQSMGRLPEAKACFEAALTKFGPALERDRVDNPARTATLLHGLADVCWAIGDAERPRARKLYVDALEIYAAGAGNWKLRYADALLSVAEVYETDGREAEANDCCAQAQRLCEEIGDDKRLARANFLLKLARARRRRGRSAEAMSLYDQAMVSYQTAGAPRCEGYAAALLDLTELRTRSRDLHAAERGFQDVITIFRTDLGSVHPNLGWALYLQARFWLAGRARTAADCHDQTAQALELLAPAFGEQHPWTREAREFLHSAAAQS